MAGFDEVGVSRELAGLVIHFCGECDSATPGLSSKVAHVALDYAVHWHRTAPHRTTRDGPRTKCAP